MRKIVLLSIFLTLTLCCQSNHENQELKPEIVESKLNEKTLRFLQQQKPRNMKITFNFDQYQMLDLKNSTHVLFKEKTEQAIKIVAKYFSNLIKIVPRSAQDLKWSIERRVCGGGNTFAKIPESDRTTDRDTDLHLYITYDDDRGRGQSWIAYAAPCQEIKGLGPTHGQVTFNFERLTKYRNLNNPIDFQGVVDVLTHEVIHVLGFNKESWKNWVDSNKKPHKELSHKINVRGLITTFLKTPNILKFAREYYNCPTLQGMPLENQGGSGNIDGHWENTAVMDELMRAVVSNTKGHLTGFTAALLQDTGYYAEINQKMVENSTYGKGAGCDFLLSKCNENSKEYCNLKEDDSCDYYRNGLANCDQNTYYDTGCQYRRTKDNSKCFDPNHTNASSGLYQNFYGQSFGLPQSKCFMSSLAHKIVSEKSRRIQPSCYFHECGKDNTGNAIIKIQLGGKNPSTAVCTKNGEQASAIGFDGIIICPDNIEEFCQQPKLCLNFCSSNGYCEQGKCICLDGYTGESCEKKL